MPGPALHTAILTTDSLEPRKSCFVAGLWLSGGLNEDRKDEINCQNVLLARACGSANVRSLRLRARLECFDAPHLLMGRDGNKELATRGLLAGEWNDSALLSDFINLTIKWHPTAIHTGHE